MIYTIGELLSFRTSRSLVEINGMWFYARPMRHTIFHRIKAAWLVLTDKADAVVWDGNQ